MRILIVQLRRIGDVIVTTPVIDVLRERFPSARIDFLVEPPAAPVLEGYPGLDERFLFDRGQFFSILRDVRRRRYDWVLDFMNNPRTAQIAWASGAPVRAGFETPVWGAVYTHRIPRPDWPVYAVQNKFNLLRRLGVEAPTEAGPRLPLAASEVERARAWWRAAGLEQKQEVFAVMPAHRRPIRRWPAERFQAAMSLLLSVPGRSAVLVGSENERPELEALASPFPGRAQVAPAGPLRQAAALLSRCGAALTNDSGLMHLAVAVGTPTVTVYGPTWPRSWNPERPPHRFLQAQGLSCLGCNRDRCPYGHECMAWVRPEQAAAAVETVLRGRPDRP